MKIASIVFLCAFAVVQAAEFDDFIFLHHRLPPPPPADARAETPQWDSVKQKLDNFNLTDRRTWTMRFIRNGQWFKPAGPIFLLVGAEWTIDPGWLQAGQMYDMARQNGAYMFYTEHRYYGRSRPTLDLSVPNLKYLTTPQALADVAMFIRRMKLQKQFADSKVVIFGGSYGGNMAIWMREKYPDLVHAALSSSAPVKAQVDFKEYFEVVQAALSDPRCYGVIANAVRDTERYLRSGSIGIRKIQTDYNLCKPVDVNDPYDKAYFYNSIANEFAGIVQYATGGALSNACYELMDRSLPDDYSRLVSFVARRRPNCIGNYDNFVRYFEQTNIGGDSRQWFYQTCNEYGYFQTSASPNQPFGDGFPVEMNLKMCTDIFGASFDRDHVESAVASTNANYGALAPKITRVISVHGSYDPWHALGLSSDVNADSPVIVVPGASHCLDLQSVSAYDSAEMRAAKLKEQEVVREWLDQP